MNRMVFGLLFLTPLLAQTQQPDLLVSSIAATVNTDPQSLATSGSLAVSIRNAGAVGTSTGFQLTAFEDRNFNGHYDAGADAVLGTANLASPLAAGATGSLTIAVTGSLLFRGSLIYVLVDSNNVILEADESNNLRHSGQTSVFAGPSNANLNPVLRWAADTFTDLPTSRASSSTPTVGDVNGDGIPDVVFSTYVTGARGNVRVVSGNTGAVLFTITDSTLDVSPAASITLADIDADNRPELITIDAVGRVIVFEHDGTLKWRSTQLVPAAGTGIIAADLDRNGTVELVVGNQVFSATGTRLWAGTGGSGRGHGNHMAVAVADLDLDGNLEVIAGPTAYRANGTIYWNRVGNPATLTDGPVAIGNFDADPNPEVVVRPYNSPYLYMLEHDGTVKWGVNPSIHQPWGGQPVIGDADGDGQPEIGVVDRFNYILYEPDGSIRWTKSITEFTSGFTSSVIFDLNGDGVGEVIYADQTKLFILRGTDGLVLNEFPRLSITTAEGTVVADVDRDGHADILVTGDIPSSPEGRGVRMYSGANNNWANARPVWNQDGFTITNINDDLTVPVNPTPNWLTPGLNNFRTNGIVPGSGTTPSSAADITVSFLRRVDTNFPASTRLIARIGNGGAAPAPAHRVEFRSGTASGTLLGFANTSRTLNPGEYEDVAVTWSTPPAGQINIVASADTNNIVAEGDEANNQHAVQLIIGQGPFATVDDLLPRAKEGGADLKWTPVSGAVSYNIYRRTSSTALALYRAAFVSATGAFSDTGLSNNETYHYQVRWLNGQSVESEAGTEASVTPIPRTQRGDTPPSILSAPVTRGRTQTVYTYTPTVADPDAGEVLSWQASGLPSGMTQSLTTGRLEWLPGAGQGGSYRIRSTVTDSRGRKAVQEFTLFVETQAVNSPPQFLSTPVTSGALSRLYSYAVRAADPDAGEVLTFLLDAAPAGMTIHSSTGLIQWTPAATGSFPAVVRIRDLAGATALQSFTIRVQNLNRGPQITSVPGGNANATTTYSYVATATDPDAGDTLTWSLLTAPSGMSINAVSGVILWTPTTAQVGSHPVTIEVRDTLGAIATQTWIITVASALNINAAPVVTSEAVTSARVGIPYLYDVNAVDPEAQPLGFQLVAAPAGATINAATGLISWTPTAAQTGAQAFSVRVADPQNAAALHNFTVNVVVTPPATFDLISPTAGSTLTSLTNLVATIGDPNSGGPALTWTIRLTKAGMPDRQLAAGTGPVTNSTVTSLDPSAFANDTYVVRVEIFKGSEGISRDIPYAFSGDLKMGQFTTQAVDLTIPFAGVPLNISRLYNSLDTRTGDFGAGWQLESFGGVTDAPTEIPLKGLRTGDRVYVSTPEGRRVNFRFEPVVLNALFPYVVSPRFTPEAGVFDKLEVPETSVFLFDGIAHVDFLNVWNPRRYILTTKFGIRYELDEEKGVQLIRDRNGNTITFTPTAIQSSTGVQLTLTRDNAGRITVIREPSGAELRYTYDALGNLTAATNQLGQTTRYFYELPSLPNYLTRVEDPLGRSPLRNVYDSSGRLTAVCPPSGNITTLTGCNQINHQPGTRTQTVINARGLRREYTYDERGNLTIERQYLDATNFRDTTRTYDANNNLLTERDPAGNVTARTWDAAGNPLSITKPGGRTKQFTYAPACNKIATETDAAGGVITYTYDAFCQLRFVRDRAGNTTEYRYDAAGRLTHRIDPRGSTTTWTHTAQGYPASIRDPRGNSTVLTWSAVGDLLSRTDRNGRRRDFQYDASHRLTHESWSNGRLFQYGFDAAGYLISANEGTQTAAFVFDALGRLSQATSVNGATLPFIVNYTYDAMNNLTLMGDSRGGSAQYAYDGLDRLAAIQQSGTAIGAKRIEFDYDVAGLPSQLRRFASLTASSPVANTTIEYECGGCVERLAALRHTNPTGTTALQILTFGRNAVDDVTQMTDSEGLHTFQYDSALRLTGAVHPRPAVQPTESYGYDAAGNRVSSHLSSSYVYQASGNELQSDDRFVYSYDGEGNLSQRLLRSDNSLVQYEYDFRNRVTAIIKRSAAGIESGRTSFAYDALNRRITSTTTGSGETQYWYDGLHPIVEVAPGNALTRRLYGPGLDDILSEDTATGTRWLLTDQVGTVRTILDASGAVVAQLLSDSFGRPLASSSSTVNPQLTFTGREPVALSGDVYFRYRMYDPALGRFLQQDPLHPFGYAYGANSPLVKTDAFGLAEASEYSYFVRQRAKDTKNDFCEVLNENAEAIRSNLFAIAAALNAQQGNMLGAIGLACGGQ